MALKPITVALRLVAATIKMKDAALALQLARGSKAERRKATAYNKAVDRADGLREQLEDMGQAAMVEAARALAATSPSVDLKAWVAAYRAQKAASARRRALPPGSTRARVTTANARWHAAAEEWTRISRDRSDIERLVEQLVDAEVVVEPQPDPEPPAMARKRRAAPAQEQLPLAPRPKAKPKVKAKPKSKPPAPRADIRDRTRRALHQRAAKATAKGTGPLAAVWHERTKVTASNGRVASEFSADTPSACERWEGRYTRRGKAERSIYPITDVRAALFVVGGDDDVDLRGLKRLAKLAKAGDRPIGIVRKSGTIYAVAGEPHVDGEAIRQDKALGAIVLAEQTANRDAAVWVRADDLALALATAGQRGGRARIPTQAGGADALLIEIDHLGERHAVRRIEAPAPTRVAVKLDPPPPPARKRCTPPTEGQWAALTCKGGRVSVEHFDSQAQAEEYLAAADGPDWGYAAQIDAIFRA